MRSSGATKALLDGSVAARTKSRIACFADPSFHEASELTGVWAFVSAEPSAAAVATIAVAEINSDRRPSASACEEQWSAIFRLSIRRPNASIGQVVKAAVRRWRD